MAKSYSSDIINNEVSMINKLYKSIFNFIKENLIFIIIIAICLIITNVKLPYSIECPGGLINIDKRLSGALYQSDGSLNLTYVTVRDGTILNLAIGLINPNWDIVKNSDIKYDNETLKESYIRSKLDYNGSVASSYYVAYTNAGITPTITSNNLYVEYKLEESNTDLVVGDKILEVNGIEVASTLDFYNIIQKFDIGDTLKITVSNNNKTIERTAELIDYDGNKIIGITVINIPDMELDPEITYTGESNENGPSGGLMFTLSIYNALTENDITKGYTISGTGTIELDGSVGLISGVKYKLAGAVSNGADVFIAPSDNYEEAIKLKEENNYDITIIRADTFTEALEELEKLN
jgi:PDZ domain-containing protein